MTLRVDPADLHFPACDVCDGSDFEMLSDLRSPRMINFKGGIAICRDCGFVTMRPRPAGATYARINDIWFSETFDTDDPEKSDATKKFRKWELMWKRIGREYPGVPRHLLDVGAGQGWAIEYLKSLYPGMPATAIERWAPCADYIRSRLVSEVVDLEPSGDWPADFAGKFDLVIFRHTLEHLNDPIRALRNIAGVLSPNGAAYIVVPNAERVRVGTAMRTDFFRPVHLHYFNEHTLRRLAARAGLRARLFAAESELWGLFERSGADAGAPVNTYANQSALLKARLMESQWRDRKAIALTRLRQAYRAVRSIGR